MAIGEVDSRREILVSGHTSAGNESPINFVELTEHGEYPRGAEDRELTLKSDALN